MAQSTVVNTPLSCTLPEQCSAPRPTITAPSYTKPAPSDLYKRLLPAGLFLLTFVTVMTMLLIYMDTTAAREQQFRANMSGEVEYPRVSQDDPKLVAYVRQLHLLNHPQHHHTTDPKLSDLPQDLKTQLIAALTKDKVHGTFVEALVRGDANGPAAWLESSRGWRGLRARADPRDYLALRPAARPSAPALNACVSNAAYPKEIKYREPSRAWSHDGVSAVNVADEGVEWFAPRVKCFPLYTLLLAVNATNCDYLVLGTEPGEEVAVLQTLPMDKTRIQILEIEVSADSAEVSTVTSYLQSHGYRLKTNLPDCLIFLREHNPVLKI